MLFSRDKKFLFIHVPKTGGTSMVTVLKKYSNRVPLPLRAIGYFFDDRGVKLPTWTYPITGYPYHVTGSKLKEIWGDETYESYFKFSFVRNPWDLVVSEYEYILQKKSHHLNDCVVKLGSFEQFLKWKEKHYARPQVNWVCDSKGNLVVDYVGRFEDYTRNANEILNKLNIEERVPHTNSTKRGDYRNYYTEETVAAVNRMYRPDIELFGYQFL